jgi:hypothetical protein
VPEHQRFGHDAIADPAMLVIVDVRAAYADRADLDQDFEWTWVGHRPVLDPQVAGAMKDGGAVSVIRRRVRHALIVACVHVRP